MKERPTTSHVLNRMISPMLALVFAARAGPRGTVGLHQRERYDRRKLHLKHYSCRNRFRRPRRFCQRSYSRYPGEW